MNRKSRQIRKYQASFGMDRQTAKAHYEKMQAQAVAQIIANRKVVDGALFYSETLKQRVTIPA